MMNPNQYQPNAYYQGAPGYPKSGFPSQQTQANGHWQHQQQAQPPSSQQQMTVPNTGKKPTYQGQTIEPPHSANYHNPSAYQPGNSPYYARPPIQSSNVQQQYPPANMSPQAPRHYPVQQQHQQRFNNSYSSSPYRNESDSKGPYPYASQHSAPNNYNYESTRNQIPYNQQPPHQRQQPPPPSTSQQPTGSQPAQHHLQQQQQPQQPNMYPNMSSHNMSYPQRHYMEPRPFGNSMNNEQQTRSIRFPMSNNYSNQQRMAMANLSSSPVSSLKCPSPQSFNSIRPQSPMPTPANIVSEPSMVVKKETNDKHLRQALSSTLSSAKENRIETVEMTRPLYKRIKPLTNIGNVDHRKILMSLKSGLLAETTWAFDCLNILSNNGSFRLASVPSMLTNLMDYYKCYLNTIFDDMFADTENDYQIKIIRSKHDNGDEMGKEELDKLIRKGEKMFLLDSTNYTFKSRNGLPVEVKTEPQFDLRGIPISNDLSHLEETCDYTYFQDGNGLVTAHIVTTMGPFEVPESFVQKSKPIDSKLHDHICDDGEIGLNAPKRKLDTDFEAELIRPNTLCARGERLESLIKRCYCLSTIIRNLSFMPENSHLMAQNSALLLVLARLLTFNHVHHEKKSFATILNCIENKSNEKENQEAHEVFNDYSLDALHLIRMNTMVTLSNMSEFIDLADYSDKIILPLLDSLLHWAVCPSSYAKDHHPPDNLSFQLLSFEIIVKMSMKVANIDLMLATPPFSRLEDFYKILVCSIGKEEDQVLRELSLVILTNFACADILSARIILHMDYSICNLLTFIEQYEFSKRTQMYNRYNTHTEPFTISYMLKNAALTLRTLAAECERKDLQMIKKHEERIVDLTMSILLEPEVSLILADLIYILSNDKSK
ncbi:hypothetical protein RDWZM_000798 [Blomia tropicalis]|uniref:SWI/SNF-like complex subunit BAF250 C-terminal domain-containing protein n=1 Tax=Blomia tropicalis TaxID=40697 RepID=A0A9Q0MBM2_BLOTA|nr:hypothetical protein RDWZM_000798 [Blomia tropicalis]